MRASLALPLRTDRLVLRPYTTTDVEPTLDYYRNPAVSRFLLTEPFGFEDAQQAVERRRQRTHPTQPGDTLALVVENDGRVVGDVVLELLGERASMGEIGWCFHPRYAGRGFATEAASALLDLAFGHYELHRVKAQMDARNTASARLCERLGMTKEAHLRQDWWSKDEWTDTLVYAVLSEEWKVG
ncbi:GNAT family N-acetyltransferase [Nocardioides sp. AX2bis]|uniref:GNAT family N-acetyltransferase n=1 Tax=Nocardioides sp. AX2bis TaxID=2653157 RepID=UPI0012F269E2|nr:GNAT family protein [Nocardioides sp. AX2bis]VXB60603.1 Aminoglycoside 6'-N-acetyltransferase [Nocardioides sp. AX2bis]